MRTHALLIALVMAGRASAADADGDYSYHHCALVDITADPSRPLDTRWAQLLRQR